MGVCPAPANDCLPGSLDLDTPALGGRLGFVLCMRPISPGLSPLHASTPPAVVTTKGDSRRCQMSPKAASALSRTTGLGVAYIPQVTESSPHLGASSSNPEPPSVSLQRQCCFFLWAPSFSKRVQSHFRMMLLQRFQDGALHWSPSPPSACSQVISLPS